MKVKILIVFFSLFFNFYLAKAIDTLVVEGGLWEEHVVSGSYLEILEDKSTNLKLVDVLNDSIQKKFILNKASYSFNENPKSAYWIKITVKNLSKDFNHYILESYSLNTFSLQLYYLDNLGNIHVQETGESIKYPQRDHRHKNLVLDLPMSESGGTRTFYIRVYSNLHSGFDYHIKSLSWFVSYTINEYYLLGIFYGILLIMALYNLIIFFTIKARVHLYYVFYILSGILFTLNEDKLGFQYIWPQAPYLNPILAYHVAPMLFICTFVLYGIEFLELKTRKTKFFLIVLSLTGIYIILFTINLFFPLGLTLRFFFMFPFLAMYIASWYYYTFVKGQRAARLFVIGATFILLSVILIQLRSIGLMPGNIYTVYLLNYSLVVESVILSIALSERIKGIQKDKVIAQQEMIKELEENKRLQLFINQQLQEKHFLQEKVNRELEQKVQERTFDLKKANDEIQRMNELLHADNEKLVINVKELAKARVMLKGVDFEEFSKIYPDEDSCYKFLSELKWKDDYKCKKCSHDNFCGGQTSYSKRCTKCRYDESPTAYTIFQGIKFPINKAFYILFLFYSSKEKLTSTEISRILFLRQKTCWSFIHKIMEVSKNKTVGKSKSIDGWPSLVLE